MNTKRLENTRFHCRLGHEIEFVEVVDNDIGNGDPSSSNWPNCDDDCTCVGVVELSFR